MSEIVIERPEREEIANEYAPLLAQVEAVAVTNIEEHASAQEFLAQIAAQKKAVEARLNPIIKSAHQAHKGLTTLRNELTAPLDAARKQISGELDRYEREQARIAEERRRKAEAEARRREEERQLLDAIAAEEAGDAEEAAAILNEPVETPTVHVPQAAAKVSNVISTTRWSAEVTSLPALIKFCAANPEWMHLLQPDTSALNGLARSQREALSIPGVKAVSETTRTVRAAS